MRKTNTQKFPDQTPKNTTRVPKYPSAAAAAQAARAEALAAGISPSAVMAVTENGYATGEGGAHRSSGIVAGEPPRPSRPASSPVVEEPEKKEPLQAESDDAWDSVVESSTPYDQMGKRELTKLAKERGIPGYYKMRKEQLAEALAGE